jgi:hypothetical protein
LNEYGPSNVAKLKQMRMPKILSVGEEYKTGLK